MWLFLVLLAVPLIEIALFIQLGGAIGTWWTIGIVVVTALIGAYALRSQGAVMMRRAQSAMSQPDDIPNMLGEGLLLFAAGLLLLTPGFLTDGIGALLLFPPTRRAIWSVLSKRVIVRAAGFGAGAQAGAAQAGAERAEHPQPEPRRPFDDHRPDAPARRDADEAVILSDESGSGDSNR